MLRGKSVQIIGAIWRNLICHRQTVTVFTPESSCSKPRYSSLFAPKLSHFYSKIIGYRFSLRFGVILSVRQTFGSKPNCQRGTVSTLEFRFEAKLSMWISTLESFCRKLIFFCSLFYAKMVVSRFIIEFWRTGVSVDNRRFCPILWQKVRQKCRVENRFFVRFLRQNFRISIRK